jgi:hypothetical protein
VSAAGLGQSPSGTVLFFSGGTQLPGSVFLIPWIAPAGTVLSTATLQTTALPNWTDSITAQYTDDPNYTGSTSAAITITVAPDFTPTLDASSISIANPGSPGSLNLTITGQTGYNGTVNLSAASCTGLTVGAACLFSPTSITGTGTTKLTITTMAPHMAAPAGPTALNGWASGGLAVVGVFLLGTVPRKRRWAAVMGLSVLACLMTVVGCSGGGGGGGGGTPGTPLGSYPITVTAAGQNFSHQTAFTLVVQ